MDVDVGYVCRENRRGLVTAAKYAMAVLLSRKLAKSGSVIVRVGPGLGRYPVLGRKQRKPLARESSIIE